MKKNISFPIIIVITVLVSSLFFSCRKIDTIKLVGDWKVVTLSSSYTFNNEKFETTFDGTTKTSRHLVSDTIVTEDAYTGAIYTDYHNDGTYVYSETFKHNVTGITETLGIDGHWYFTGPNAEAEWAVTDLLAMQASKSTFNTDMGNPHTTIYQGQNTLEIYEIVSLSKTKIVLKMQKAETINFTQYVTTMDFTLEPR
ncbi:MAG TPA: hypothetical protein PLL90_05050 [Bacteroidales bacterium]|nr:hypothetical protein [Bacteroidales bacterium]